MEHTARILSLFAFSAVAVLAQSPQSISTIGPVALCENQAVIDTHFNPFEYTISKHVSVIDTGTGRIIDSRTITVLPQRGESVVYQQGRIVLDADFNEIPDTCRSTTIGVIVFKAADDRQPYTVRGYDKTHRLTRSTRFRSGTFLPHRASRATSAPFSVDAASNVTVRLMNLGPAGGAYTVEVLDAIAGRVIAAKTVSLDPGPDQTKPASGAFAEFTFPSEAGTFVARITVHTPDWKNPIAGDPGSTEALPAVALSLQVEDGAAQGEIAMEELQLVHEGFKLD